MYNELVEDEQTFLQDTLNDICLIQDLPSIPVLLRTTHPYLQEDDEGVFIVDKSDVYILINENNSLERKIKNLYHEYGHYLLFLGAVEPTTETVGVDVWWNKHMALPDILYHTDICAHEAFARSLESSLGDYENTDVFYKFGMSFLSHWQDEPSLLFQIVPELRILPGLEQSVVESMHIVY